MGTQRSPKAPESDTVGPGKEKSVASPFARLQSDLELLVNDTELEMHQFRNSTMPINLTSLQKANQDVLMPRRQSTTSLEPVLNDSMITRSLWIGNLDPTISEAELWNTFEPLGAIESLRLLPTKECAFVNYYKIDDAVSAREKLQGTALGNMIIRIGYGRADGSHIGGTPSIQLNGDTGRLPMLEPIGQSRSVWVGHIGPDLDADILGNAFSQFGDIESVRLLEAKNCAFINFINADDASRARKTMNGVRIGSVAIKTGFAKSNSLGRMDAEPVTNKTVPMLSRNESSSGMLLKDDSQVCMSTKEVGPDEFKVGISSLPASLQLPSDLNSTVIRECRRRIEHSAASMEEIDQFANQIIDYLLAAAVDPVGNILVQKLVERGSNETRDTIVTKLCKYVATVGIHKNGTWVVQKLIHNCRTAEQRKLLTDHLRPHIVPLLQDQFGNYVVQCCLAYGPSGNQFIFDALYHRCVDIAVSRFGSRAMRSCLESHHASSRQKKFVAMAVINHALTLVHDQNGVIVVQWFLDSDLPGRHAFMAPVLRGNFASLCLSKHASSVVAKLIHPSADISARDLVIDELTTSSSLSALLTEPISAAIILRCLVTGRPDQKVKMADIIEPHLAKLMPQGLPHLQKISEEVKAAHSIYELGDNTSEDPLQKVFSFGPTLLSHAVGGPVSNQAIVKLSGRPVILEPPSPFLARSYSFGTASELDSPEPLIKTPIEEERLSFGPSLLQHLDSESTRPSMTRTSNPS